MNSKGEERGWSMVNNKGEIRGLGLVDSKKEVKGGAEEKNLDENLTKFAEGVTRKPIR